MNREKITDLIQRIDVAAVKPGDIVILVCPTLTPEQVNEVVTIFEEVTGLPAVGVAAEMTLEVARTSERLEEVVAKLVDKKFADLANELKARLS